MYVCLCNGYRDSDLRALASRGIASAAEAYEALGNGPSCGRCLEFAQEIMDRAQDARAAQAKAPEALKAAKDAAAVHSRKPAAL